MSGDISREPTIAKRIEELHVLYEREMLGRRSHEDAFRIQGDPDGPYGSFKPDLDTFKYLVASHSGGADALLGKSTGYLIESWKMLSRTFFEHYPLYADLEKFVTREDTPKLYQDLETHERARKLLLQFIQAVLESRGDATYHLVPCIAPGERGSLRNRAVGSSLPARGARAIDEQRPSQSRTSQELVEELQSMGRGELAQELAPREDCLRIMGDPGGPYAGFKVELDWYMYTIASFARAAIKLTTDTIDSLLASRLRFSQNFFEICPQYADLERLVTRENTPTLYESFDSYERARRLLLELTDVMLESRGEDG